MILNIRLIAKCFIDSKYTINNNVIQYELLFFWERAESTKM